MEEFVQENPKHPSEEYYVSIDISAWCGSETIQNVNYTAFDETGQDVTATVIDSVKSTFVGKVLKPFIKAGTARKVYKIISVVTTLEGSKGVYTFSFEVRGA